MNKVFCVSCGFKILYEVTKPKFCSSCGENVGGVSAASKKEEVEEASELDIDIEKLQKDISVEVASEKTTLEDLWASSAPPSDGDSSPRRASDDPEGQALLDKTIADCSSSRTKDINE